MYFGLLDVIPQRLNWCQPSYYGCDDLETLWPLILRLIGLGSLRCCLERFRMALHLHQSTNPILTTEQKMADFAWFLDAAYGHDIISHAMWVNLTYSSGLMPASNLVVCWVLLLNAGHGIYAKLSSQITLHQV